jgi:hypothetical protein
MTTHNDDFLTEKQDSNTIWLNIYEGMLCEKRASPAPGLEEYTSRSTKSAGKILYIKHYDSIKGYLSDIQKETKETLDGKKYTVLQFTLRSLSGRKAVLQVNAKSDFVAEFAKRCESFDLMKKLEIGVFWGSKTQSSVATFKQDGEIITSNYTKDNPGKLPQWIKDEITGDWDNRDYWTFLYNLIKTKVTPEKLQAVNQMVNSLQIVEESPSVEVVHKLSEEEAEQQAIQQDDEIPF